MGSRQAGSRLAGDPCYNNKVDGGPALRHCKFWESEEEEDESVNHDIFVLVGALV